MIRDETYEQIRPELRALIAEWRSKAPWLLAVGFGRKQVGGIELNQDALVFLVDDKVPERQLTNDTILPRWVTFEHGDLTLPTDVRPAHHGWFLAAPACSNARPAHGGDCIAPLGAPFVGTLGVTALRITDNTPFILSASHTMSGIGGFLQPGQIICHPIGSSTELAVLSKSTAWSTTAPMEGDVALAEITFPNGAEPGVNNIPGVSGTAEPRERDPVRFSAMHGLKKGTISLVHATVTIGLYQFENTFLINPDAPDAIGELGDSGAVVVNLSNQIVGVVFGANGFYTFATDITAVTALELDDYRF